MKIFQSELIQNTWTTLLPMDNPAHWVLALGNRDAIASPDVFVSLRQAFPHAQIVGCSTSGEIQRAQLYDDSLCITAVEFEHSSVRCCSANIRGFENEKQLVASLVSQLSMEGLRHIFVLSDGQLINGSELVNGFMDYLPPHVLVTGGLAGDGIHFKETKVWHNQNTESGLVVVTAFYGDHLKIGHGHLGGWKTFGPERVITKSTANVLYEIDGRPALELYKEYLGDFSSQLPASALFFPIAITQPGSNEPIVRTILSIDEAKQTMLFAGDMPIGATCQLMRSNYENLVDGASGAVTNALTSCKDIQPELAILISCVGRRLVLAQRTEEELEVVADDIQQCPMTGFYSYGEISPLVELGRCGLHNQTMTITLLSELL